MFIKKITDKKVKKIWERKRVGTVIRRIWECYEPHLKDRKKPVFYATDMLAKIPGSNVTIWKAKRALGIKPKVIAGRHVWAFPTHSLDVALKAVNARRSVDADSKKEDLIRSTVSFLKTIIADHHYDVTAKDARRDLILIDACRRNDVIAEATRRLQIQHIHPKQAHDGQHHWILAGEEVIGWLIGILGHGDMQYSKLVERAQKEHKWSEYVLNVARKQDGAIYNVYKNGQLWWHDYNYQGPRQVQKQPPAVKPEPQHRNPLVGKPREKPAARMDVGGLDDIIL